MKSSQLNYRQLFSLMIAESRGAKRRMLFFIICIAIGVGAVMTVKSFSNLVGETIQGQAKALLSADLAIKGSWEQSQKDLDYQRQILPAETEFLFIRELHGMAQFNNREEQQKTASLITELKTIPLTGPRYPFYGEFKSKPEKPLQELLVNNGAVVDPSFLLKTGLKQGD
ncbi:MAG: ABC transporter permease, partial [Nitrospinae bacterium]|nr:ABC transporter permease [Nitrospinota bacterium]